MADPRLQRAVARLLAALDAQDFLCCRDGDRPPVGALAAVDTRTLTRHWGRYAGVGAADSQQCVDPIEQDWRVRMWAARLADGALRRVMRQWLQAGGLDTDGPGLHPVPGTPEGGTVAPLLAQVCRHDARALWFATVVKQPGRGAAGLRRDAADFVGAFDNQAAAARCDHGLGPRLETCGRERSGAKTRLLPVSRHRQAGHTSCEVLGFEWRWGQERRGREPLTRRTARQQLRAALKRFTAWCQERRHRRLPGLFQRLNATCRG